jgi:subtilisin family serine protease
VAWAEPNYFRRAMSTVPDDIDFDKSWGLNNTGQSAGNGGGTADADIDAPEAWDITRGSETVVIAVIDSGIDYNHPDLKDNLWTNSGEIADNGVDDDGNGYIDDVHGWNFLDDSNDIMDSNDHGTHVAGIIAARGNNAAGSTGVCWEAKLMVLKFLDPFGVGSVSDEVAAIEYAMANGAHVINASFGDAQDASPEFDVIGRAEQEGLLFVTAAGNTGDDIDQYPIYPAGYPFDNIIAVAASGQNDERPSWSNYGIACVDVAAPGVNVYGPVPGRVTFWEEDFESDLSGWNLDGGWARTSSESYTGTHALADSPAGEYTSGTEYSAGLPVIPLDGKNNIRLYFYLKGRSEAEDKLYIDTSDTATGPWSPQTVEVITVDDSATYTDGISGHIAEWAYAKVALDHLAGEDTAYVRFRFDTNSGEAADGWLIDEIQITSMDDTYPDPQSQYYRFVDGTSAATPFVSGLAGLLWSLSSGLTSAQVKSLILDGVDILPAFSETVSGGRINAYNSLRLALNQGTSSNDNDTEGGSSDDSGTSGSSANGSSGGGFCFIGTAFDPYRTGTRGN